MLSESVSKSAGAFPTGPTRPGSGPDRPRTSPPGPATARSRDRGASVPARGRTRGGLALGGERASLRTVCSRGHHPSSIRAASFRVMVAVAASPTGFSGSAHAGHSAVQRLCYSGLGTLKKKPAQHHGSENGLISGGMSSLSRTSG